MKPLTLDQKRFVAGIYLVAATREAHETAERARDKSNDAAESERVRRAIGMPPNTSLERTREE